MTLAINEMTLAEGTEIRTAISVRIKGLGNVIIIVRDEYKTICQ